MYAQQAGSAELALHLRADEQVPYGPVAKVMAAIERTGIARVAVLTQSEQCRSKVATCSSKRLLDLTASCHTLPQGDPRAGGDPLAYLEYCCDR